MPSPFPTNRMLGIDFFIGTPAEAVAQISKQGGLVVAPAAPSFVALQDDRDYRRAIADADLAIADSGWAILFWRLLRREKLTRISGLALFKALLETRMRAFPKICFGFCRATKQKRKRSSSRAHHAIRLRPRIVMSLLNMVCSSMISSSLAFLSNANRITSSSALAVGCRISLAAI